MSRYVEKNLNENEILIHKIKLDIWPLIGHWVVAVLLCWMLLIPVVIAIVKTVRYCCIAFAVTNKRIVYKAGVFRKYTIDVPLDKVVNVVVETTFWGRLFNFAELFVYTETAVVPHKPFSPHNPFPFEDVDRTPLPLRVRQGDKAKQIIMAQVDNFAESRAIRQANWTAEALATVLANQQAGKTPVKTTAKKRR